MTDTQWLNNFCKKRSGLIGFSDPNKEVLDDIYRARAYVWKKDVEDLNKYRPLPPSNTSQID